MHRKYDLNINIPGMNISYRSIPGILFDVEREYDTCVARNDVKVSPGW